MKAQWHAVFDLDFDSLARSLSFLQESQCALLVVPLIGLLFNAVQWFLLQVLSNPIQVHENPRTVQLKYAETGKVHRHPDTFEIDLR